MQVIIAGSRSLKEQALIQRAVNYSNFEITEVVSGCASGIDTLAIRWADRKKIPVRRMPAAWNDLTGIPETQIRSGKFGKYNTKAGYDRNTAMAKYVGEAGGLIAIWDGVSKGTLHMIEEAKKFGLKVCVYEV